LAMSRRLGNPSQIVIALTALGNAVIDRDPMRARAAFEESLQLVVSGASDVNLPLALVQLARLRMRDGDLDAALAAARVAVAHLHRVGDRPGLPGALLIATEILMAARAYRPAVVLAVAARGGVLSELAAGMDRAGSALAEPLSRAREALGDAVTDAAVAE